MINKQMKIQSTPIISQARMMDATEPGIFLIVTWMRMMASQ
jgi:hypothetical protein